jgi:hypothetical protein
MFEKIPSLKDFIIYVIPGLMICFCIINIINHNPSDQFPQTKELSKDVGVALISVLFSFIVGFIFSQFQIIFLNKIVRWKHPFLRTLFGTDIDSETKLSIMNSLISEFKLAQNDNLDVQMKDENMTELAINYLNIKANDNSVRYFERDSHLASFAITLPLPIILFCIVLINSFNLSFLTKYVMVSASSIILTLLCIKISVNFRKGWVKKVFFQFFILAQK